METVREENPYQSPEAADAAPADQARIARRVRLGWQYPLLGILPLGGMWLGALLLLQTSLMHLLLLACFAVMVAGLTMTVYGVFHVLNRPALFPHVLAGVTANALFLLATCGSAFVMAFMLRPT